MMNQQQQSFISASTLYVVPTPIGNLGDITYRALTILKNVNLIAVEDTRHTALMLQHFSINTRLFLLNDYNERKKTVSLLAKLQAGQSIALVSDAGTPIINDPGYYFLFHCRKAGIRIVPLPGACAAITALCASGITSNRFCFEGFLPKKHKARQDTMRSLSKEPRTLIFYESTHRLIESLQDMITIWGPHRYVVLARELTKNWESIYGAPVGLLLPWVQEYSFRSRGEMVLIVKGHKPQKNELSLNALRALTLLRQEMPLKRALAIISEIYDIRKNSLYKYVLDEQKAE